MVLQIVVLSQSEEFVCFLDPEFISIIEENEAGELGRINVEYTMNDVSEAEQLFKIGNKVWIQGDPNLKDCLYVINTTVQRDYYSENKVTFTAEDKLTVLNNNMFSQTELSSDNGFTINRINNQDNVLVNYNALSYWFGQYFNIGVVQDCLSSALQRVVLTGTMTLMELLRYLEEETGNVFLTRYEKDVQTNVIHPYLDFLNPINSDKNWVLNIDYSFPDTEGEDPIDDENEDVVEEDDIVVFPPAPVVEPLVPEETYFELFNKDDMVWSACAADVGLTTDIADVVFNIAYNSGEIVVSVNERVFTSVNEETGAGDRGFDIEDGTPYSFANINLSNDAVFRIVDENRGAIYEQHIHPLIGEVHEKVLDIGYNVENITYEIDEEETFTSIAPLIGENDELTRTQLNTVINRWINLEIEKGDTIPMIVQSINYEGTMTGYSVSSKYYARPLNPNDNDEEKEYLVATAYWSAPYAKNAGEIYVEEDEKSFVEYQNICFRQDIGDERGETFTPKMGTVETSDEDPYSIYNDVVMKLREKKYPSLSLEVDVANIEGANYNDYNLYDKVYIKVPGFEQLIRSNVTKTTKNAHNIGENTVELNNDCVLTKHIPQVCDIVAENDAWDYPKTKNITATLLDANDEPISNRLISVNVYVVDESGNSTPTSTVYNRKTNSNGEITIAINYDPSDYELVFQFGGDVEYAPVETTCTISISGAKYEAMKQAEIERRKARDAATKSRKSKAKKKKTKTKVKKQYYTKYGVNPKGTLIMAIGRPITKGEKDKYNSSNFYGAIFVRKCKECGSTELYWSIYWGKNESSESGKFPATKKQTDYANKGLIVCKKCGAKYSAIGNNVGKTGGKPLTVYNGTYKSKKTEAYLLKKGKMEYKKVEKVNRRKKVKGNDQQPLHSVDKKVARKARSIVGNSRGIAAAKKIAYWVGKNITWLDYPNFVRKPRTVLERKAGNCCDQTRLMLMMMDAVGVSRTCTLEYIHVTKGKRGHVFAKITTNSTGTKRYVDPTHSPWWNTYLKGRYGSLPPTHQTTYPTKPF